MGVGAVTTAPGSIDGALEIVRGGHDSWSVVISPRRTHVASRRLLYQARASLEESLVAAHVTELSPLGTTVLNEMAQPLRESLPSEQILPALAALESQIRCLTVAPSVTNMSEPKVPLWLHARSWLPGGTYIAERGHVARSLSRKKPEKALHHFPAAAEGYIAVVAESTSQKSRGERLSFALETLLEHLEPHDVVRRPNMDPEWWGSRDAVQIVLAPTNLGEALKLADEFEPTVDDIPARVLTASDMPALLASADDRDENQEETW